MAVRTIKDIKLKLDELENRTDDFENEYYLGITNILREEIGRHLYEVDSTSSEYLRGIDAGQKWLEHEDAEISF